MTPRLKIWVFSVSTLSVPIIYSGAENQFIGAIWDTFAFYLVQIWHNNLKSDVGTATSRDAI